MRNLERGWWDFSSLLVGLIQVCCGIFTSLLVGLIQVFW